MIIRQAEKADIEAMARVVSNSWQCAYKSLISEEDMKLFSNVVRREELFKASWDSRLNYVLLWDGSVMGVCSVERHDKDSKDGKDGYSDTAEIDQFYLEPEIIGQGFGKRLMEYVLQELKGKGFARVVLYVMEGNERAIGFYERSGFKADGGFSVCENLSGKNRGLRYVKNI